MKYFVKTKTLLLLAVAGLGLGVASCKKDFLDINNNPNAPTSASITPELLFQGAAIRSAALQGGGNNTFLDNWMGYTGASGDFVPDLVETRYDISSSFATGNWTTRYDILEDLQQSRDLALAKGDSVLAGASMILSDKLWQELVDLYNNIPYSQALNISGTATPSYDNGAAVYVSLEADLDKAIRYMQGTPTSSYGSAIAPVIHFGGTPSANGPATGSTADLPKWVRFANTLKLRMLIRTSEVTVAGLDRNAELAKIISNGGPLGAGETLNVNPGYSNDAAKQSPFYGTFGWTSTGIDANSIVRANKYTIDTMNTYGDPRLQRLYRGAGSTVSSNGGAIVGVNYGAPTNPGGTASSKVGYGTANNSAQDQWIMTSVESLFLTAEAVARGWLPGDPATAYNNAVKESFTFLGVPNAATAATTYLTSNPRFTFGNTSVYPTAVAQIVYQKYLAMNQIDPLEAYSDYRRLHIPSGVGFISQNTDRLANNLPNRLVYPQEEYSLNGANASAQGVLDKTTLFTTAKMFWQP